MMREAVAENLTNNIVSMNTVVEQVSFSAAAKIDFFSRENMFRFQHIW